MDGRSGRDMVDGMDPAGSARGDASGRAARTAAYGVRHWLLAVDRSAAAIRHRVTGPDIRLPPGSRTVSSGLTDQAALFIGSLLLALVASEGMTRGLTRLGSRLRLSEGVQGLLTALGADAPELASAVIALAAGSREVGLGVVLGSNLFNLAALLGLSALVAGELLLHRAALVLDGGVGLVALALAGVLLSGVVGRPVVAVALLAVFAVYAAALALPPGALRRLRITGPLLRAVVLAPGHVSQAVTGPWTPVLLLPVSIAAVVVRHRRDERGDELEHDQPTGRHGCARGLLRGGG